MKPRSAVVVAVAATAVVVSGFCAWFLRPRSDLEIIQLFPAALARKIAAGDWDEVEARLDPSFKWKGATGLDREECLAALRSATATKKFHPVVGHSEPVRADVDQFRVVVYGVVIEGDPAKERRPPFRAFRLEALVARRGAGFVVLEADL